MSASGLISVIVTTYNRPDALLTVLRALAVQQDKAFEVIVADDGSTSETRAVVEKFSEISPVAVIHVWQEDRGFRAGASRNRAVSRSRGEYLVFLDGDCIPRPDFISNHRLLSEPGFFVAGNRILLSRKFTKTVLSEELKIGDWSFVKCTIAMLAGKINRILPLIALPNGKFRKKLLQEWRGVRTCNLAVWRKDFIAVNGFDETYEGWGHEDADLAVRLIRGRVYRKDGRFATGVFHLWHTESDRSMEPQNIQRLQAIIESTHTQAAKGLDQYRETN